MSEFAAPSAEVHAASTTLEGSPAPPEGFYAAIAGAKAEGGQDAVVQEVTSGREEAVPVAAETVTKTPGSAKDTTETVQEDQNVPAIGSRAEFKRLDEVWDEEECEYVLKESAPPPPPKPPKVDAYGAYCFTIIRRVDHRTGQPEWIKIELKSRWLKKTCGVVIGGADGISWNTRRSLRVLPEIFIRYFSLLESHLTKMKEDGADEAKVSQLELLVDFIRIEYAAKFEELRSLVSRKEINFELLGCLLMPETLLFHHCSLTGEPRVSRLVSCVFVPAYDRTPAYWSITAVYVETAGTRSKSKPHFGYSYEHFSISDFKGVYKIYKLSVHPFHWTPRADELRAQLIERGKQWWGLDGLHHMRYDGIAYRSTPVLEGRGCWLESVQTVTVATWRDVLLQR
ncbi:hypothetical protein AURDEDRAFT_183546 [Auricularia subglabra TFB-10046 SS5]|nr:hypothetical protein AURDEDRAFT_183546 [Auricularia subglabra TFB-10046 SS5]